MTPRQNGVLLACRKTSLLVVASMVRLWLGRLPRKVTLTESADENVAEDSVRHICENGLVKIVSSFQRYAEACFHKLPNAGSFNIRRNLFQNLTESDAIWRGATGSGYTEFIG